MPLIPTAALEHALGGALPVMAFLRALSSGDAETFTRLGGLCFVPEDLELVDYITGAEPRATRLLAALLAPDRGGAGHMIRGLWDRETVALLLLAAAVPLAALWLASAGWAGAYRLAFFLLAAGIWHLVFMLARAQPPSFAGAIDGAGDRDARARGAGSGAAWLLGVSFGVVMAELAFGGWGRNVLNPAVVTLAFLGFGFPAAPWPEIAVAGRLGGDPGGADRGGGRGDAGAADRRGGAGAAGRLAAGRRACCRRAGAAGRALCCWSPTRSPAPRHRSAAG